ncbi:MAG: iron-siderophore ABC transporter substrate-binding protein [Gulosibacter sp.]|uniref:iron-siderophore ABC transporter substrate-binding protein n=1 Tax=Gulosibacter sp. TaxID=2817531 RepID=UPI003F8E95B9
MRLKRLAAASIAVALMTSLAACATGGPATEETETGSAASDGQFPITIEHTYGETVIQEKPENVATIAWSNQDVPLALGVSPVGFAAASWGVEDDSRMLEWTKAAVEELGGDPVLFDETDGLDFDAIANTQPDVILAAYSGITEEEYETLSQIAPTVAYPEIPWATTWREMIELNSTALGLQDEGTALVTELDGLLEEKRAEHPELDGLTAAFFYGGDATDLSTVGYYNTSDPRAAYLEDLGLEVPESVAAASEDAAQFYNSVSAENVDQLNDIDIIVFYGDQAALDAWKADPLLSQIRAIQNDSVVLMGSDGAFAASVSPSPLSIPTYLDDYLALISEAAAKVQ